MIWVINDWLPSVVSPDISRRLAAHLSARLHAGRGEVESGEITAEEMTRERPDLIVAGQRTKETNTPCGFVVYTQAAVGHVWSFSGRPDLKFKVRLIRRSLHFCITTSILTGATYIRVRLIVEILR